MVLAVLVHKIEKANNTFLNNISEYSSIVIPVKNSNYLGKDTNWISPCGPNSKSLRNWQCSR